MQHAVSHFKLTHKLAFGDLEEIYRACEYLKEGEAASITQVVAPALGEQEVVVDAGQALPGHQVKVELWLLIQLQLAHHGGKEGGVLLVEAASAILLYTSTEGALVMEHHRHWSECMQYGLCCFTPFQLLLDCLPLAISSEPAQPKEGMVPKHSRGAPNLQLHRKAFP